MTEQCDICGQGFPDADELEAHEFREHQQGLTDWCNVEEGP